jgi:hypothetical protein
VSKGCGWGARAYEGGGEEEEEEEEEERRRRVMRRGRRGRRGRRRRRRRRISRGLRKGEWATNERRKGDERATKGHTSWIKDETAVQKSSCLRRQRLRHWRRLLRCRHVEQCR